MPPLEHKKNTRVAPVLRVYTKATLRYPGMLALIILSVFAAQAVSITVPLYLKQLIDVLSQNSPSEEVVQILINIVLVYAALGACNWVAQQVQRFSLQKMEYNVMTDLSKLAFGKLIQHGHNFFLSNFTGTLTRRITRFARSYEQVFDSFIFNFLPTILFSAGTIIVLSSRSHLLGLVVFLWVCLFIAAQIVMTIWRHPLRVARTAEDSRLTGVTSDVIGNHSAVNLFAAVEYEKSVFGEVADRLRFAIKRSWNADNVIRGIQQALGIAIEVALLGIGVLLWQDGVITAGDFLLIQMYIIGLVTQVWQIGNALRGLYDAFADASEMIDIMELPYDVKDAPNAKELITSAGAIRFDHVDFYYHKDRPILSGLNLHIRAGERVAFVGPSGAGKSTVTKLLLRLYEVSQGAIRIDDQNIREVTQDSLHRAIAFVPQEPVLFHRTLRENIAYGKRDATEEEIIAAAMAAHCHEFISALPEGYDTHVGERGVKLSGGERQRVAIARAILKNAPILVLDEATSSLDSESEALIQDALDKLMRGKTVIAIAHRLSTIMKMNRIIVMEGGKVVISGTHQELLAHESNLYKKLWEIQAGSFIADEV
jgi:ATP-binding cassette, subfamily B, bacterial